jgi:hypothetical protein
MWNLISVSVGQSTHRGRYRVEGKRLTLEWRGGRVSEWCGWVKPEVVAQSALRRLAASGAMAA